MTSWSTQDIRLDGVSLTSYAHGLEIRTGVDGLPPKRGTNVAIAYFAGQRWRPKQVDAVVRTLTMWVDGRNADGTYPTTENAKVAQMNQNLDELFTVFGKTASQIQIARDVLWPDGAGGSVLQTWYGLCEVTSAVIPSYDPDWNDHMHLSVDLLFADPFWYSSPVTAVVVI